MKRVMLLLMLMLAYPVMVTAATRYASPTGLGSTCSSGSPCALTTCVSATQAGDTCYLQQGTYNQRLKSSQMTINSGTSWSNAVTIAAVPGQTATIAPVGVQGGGAGDVIIELHGNYRYIIFDHLRLDIGNLAGACPAPSGDPNQYAMVAQGGAHHIRFQDGEMFNSSTTGQGCGPFIAWYVNDDSSSYESFHEVLRSSIHGAAQSYGMYIQTQNNLIEGNQIYNNQGYGIQVYNAYNCITHNNTIRNNILHGNGFLRAQGAMTLNGGDNIRAYNNTMYGNFAGIEAGIACRVTNVFLANNTFHANSGAPALQLYGNSTGQATNNIFSQGNVDNGASTISFQTNLCTSSGTGCTLPPGNPGFVSAAGGDFHLNAAGSPAVESGQNLSSIFTTDAELIQRAPTGPWDLGAYVFAPSGPEPQPVGNIARYLFEAGTGTTVADSSGQNHPCTLNSAAWGPGLIGAFAFTPTGTQSCSAPGVAALRPTTQFGLAGWMKATTTSASGGVIAALPNDAGLLYILPPPDGRVVCQLFDGTNFPAATSTTTVLNGVVHHVSCSYLKGDGVRIRIDNAQAPILPLNVDVSYAISGTGNLEVGRSSGDPTLGFIGSLDNVYVFDQEITAQGNTNLFNEQVPVAGLSIAHTAWFTPGVPNPGSQLGATDTNRVNHLITTPLAWRFALRKADPGSLTEYFKPMCIVNTGAGFPAWTSAVELTNAFGAQGLRYYADVTITQGFPTSVALPLDGFTAAAGKILKSPIDTTSPYDDDGGAQRAPIAQGQQIELQYEVEFGSPLVGGEAVMCRLVRENGSLLDSYSNVMSVSLLGVAPPTALSIGGTDQGGTRQ